MQKWPYADFGYLGAEQLHFMSQVVRFLFSYPPSLTYWAG